MALDFVILGEDGAPERSVPIGVDEHWELISAARKAGGMPYLLRTSDYYANAEYSLTELEELVSELERLLALENLSESVRRDSRSIVGLCRYASAHGKAVEALAD